MEITHEIDILAGGGVVDWQGSHPDAVIVGLCGVQGAGVAPLQSVTSLTEPFTAHNVNLSIRKL